MKTHLVLKNSGYTNDAVVTVEHADELSEYDVEKVLRAALAETAALMYPNQAVVPIGSVWRETLRKGLDQYGLTRCAGVPQVVALDFYGATET